MNTKQKRRINTIFCALFAYAIVINAASAQTPAPAPVDATSRSTKQATTASGHVSEAVGVVRKLDGVEQMQGVLNSARGIFIVPKYRRAAVGVGAAGGAGVLLVRNPDGGWSDPVFYNAAGLSIGLQAGAEGGNLALILNNDKAVNQFLKKNNFSVNAKAGLTVVRWNRMVQGTAGAGDVIAWTDTSGLFGDVATIEVNDIRFNQNATNAYYQRTLSATDVIKGTTRNPQAAPLVEALAAAAGPAK